MLEVVPFAAWLDQILYRRPFEGTSAHRYATAQRLAFGDFDERLLGELSAALDGPRSLLDLGCGPATFAMLAAARHPALNVIALEPSRELTRRASREAHARRPRPWASEVGVGDQRRYTLVRAFGEALPIRDGVIDIAICLSSIRHVRDRPATLRELRRVVRPGGSLLIVELDPAADARRIARHADQLGSPILRHVFGPLVVKTAPPSSAIKALAQSAGWQVQALRDDPVQPVYVMELG